MTDTRRQSTVLRWLLLCSVLLGLITMHHVVDRHIESEGSSAPHSVQQVVSDPEDDGSSAPAQDGAAASAQVCLAVLAGSVVLLISVLLIRRVRDATARVGSLRTRAGAGGGGVPPTPPVPGVDGFSHGLCVLRL